MPENIYPLVFTPIYKDYIWGGDRIRRQFQRTSCPSICAESWEISDRPEGMSIISNGTLAGTSIHQVLESMPGHILGRNRFDKTFPLLVKIIDARQRLSVQVHPDDQTAKVLNTEGKTEMWYVLAAEPGARVFSGFNQRINPATLEEALRTDCVADLLNSIPVSEGDSIYLPGGTIHAIGEGCLILEVQQNSNTTYRVFDWNRVDKNGKPRELHVSQALKTINWDKDKSKVIRRTEISKVSGNYIQHIITSPYFACSRIVLNKTGQFKNDGSSFQIFFIIDKPVVINTKGFVQQLTSGTTCLIPASIREYTLDPVDKNAGIINIRLPAPTH
ncbi:MAG: class I mannose-6-phosphate isomerase [Kiritimatiellae bacterium]|nr:class I mannose-6-phosphate isomerase [Kiritimatiellia bacterium]